jgi:hypothetical protein
MSRPRKYRAGARLGFEEVIRRCLAGEYVMARGRPTHPGWVLSWRVNMLVTMCASGIVAAAEITDEWKRRNAR